MHHTFGLNRERPHALTGFQARLAAKMTLHTFCIWLNEPLGRPSRACADLVDWSCGTISHQAFNYVEIFPHNLPIGLAGNVQLTFPRGCLYGNFSA